MKRLTAIMCVLILCASTVLAGGLVTNTNQSAEYIRTLNRNASTCIDAAYYNPAGLTKLGDGLHLAISNWTIFQTKEIESSLSTLHEPLFTGDVKAPIFPAFHAAYRTGGLAVSGSFMLIGGGGGATYGDGLPSFEGPVSMMVPQLASQGVNDYSLDVTFEGSSVYAGGQVGVSYQLNDMISVAVGGRYISAYNVIKGHLKDIQINPGGTWMPAPTFFTGAAASATDGAAQAAAAADQYELAGDLVTAAYYDYIADSLTTLATTLTGSAAMTADQEIDVKQTGTGFTVIVGANLSPMEGLNIGLRYETLTALELENDTEQDDTGEYPDGGTTKADMPALAALGVSYRVMPQLKVEAGLNYFLNTSVDWGGDEEDLENGFDVGLAGEYNITDALSASAGFLYSKSGATEDYRNDGRLDLDATALGLGVGYKLTEGLKLNLGALMTFYTEATKTLDAAVNPMTPTETYNQSTFAFAIGVNYSL